MMYKDIPQIDDELCEVIIKGDQPIDKKVIAILSLGLNSSNLDFTQSILKEILINSQNSEVKTAALVSLGHTVRRLKSIDPSLKQLVINLTNSENPEISGAANDTLDDIEIFDITNQNI